MALNKRTRQRALWTTALLASSMLTGVAAHAQEAGAVALDEVVVTAQKRSENLQDVPISVLALGGEKLEELHVAGLTDFMQFLPSVSFNTSGPGFGQIYMRGVASGGDGNHSGSLPSVGVYLDEQPITTIQGALDIHPYDLARVEALAGPQGTLYGASSQAGTIRIITNKPDTSGFYGGFDVEANKVEHGGVGHVEEGFVNLPLSDTVAVRLVGWNEKKAGYIDNVPGTRTYDRGDNDPADPSTLDNDLTISNADRAKKNYNQVKTYGGRAALRIELGDDWVISPGVMGQLQKSGGLFSYDPKVGDLQLTHFYPESSRDSWYQAALTVEGKIANLDVTYAGSYLHRDVDTQQDYSDYSYFYDQMGYGFYWVDDAGNLTNPSQYIQGKDRYEKVSHEIRVASPQDRRLRFVTGAFYQRQVHGITQDYIIDGIAEDIEVPGWADTIWLTGQKRIDRDSAVFGEASFDITEKLTATAGIRFFKAHNTLVGFAGYGAGYGSQGEAGCFKEAVIQNTPCTNVDKGVKENGNSPKLNLTYKFDDDKLVYATYSKGFRPGGVNRRSTLPPYGADYLKNYELGWKTSWLENRLRWNGAVFLEKWENFQFSLLGANGLTEIKNANQAEMKGVETDIAFAVTHGLTITASGAYTDAALTANYCGATDAAGTPITDCPVGSADFPDGPEAPDGQVLPVTPKWKGNITARYEFTAGDYDGFVQASAIAQTGSWTDLRTDAREAIGRKPGFEIFDLSGGVTRQDWSLVVYLKNVTDERAQFGRFAQCAASTCGPQTYITPNQPRTLGVKVGRKF